MFEQLGTNWKENFRKEFVILESILITTKRPTINIQTENFYTILQIFKKSI